MHFKINDLFRLSENTESIGTSTSYLSQSLELTLTNISSAAESLNTGTIYQNMSTLNQ